MNRSAASGATRIGDRFPTLTPRPALSPTAVTVLEALVVARWITSSWMASIMLFSDPVEQIRHL